MRKPKITKLGQGVEVWAHYPTVPKDGSSLLLRCSGVGGQKTGKTAIISQFLYDEYPTEHKETIEEMYRSNTG